MDKYLEGKLSDVYGQSFALYGETELAEWVGFFERRFLANEIDPIKVFENRVCLDAGCGNGRGALFMLRNGARSVHAVDINVTNVETTSRLLQSFGFSGVECREADLQHLPYPDRTFDVVFCNGVIHHTVDPDSCLQEIARVIKVGGQAWIYVYGTGGIHWYVIHRLRRITHTLCVSVILDALRLMGYPTPFVAACVDSWKVPLQHTFTPADFGARLEELGFEAIEPLPYGLYRPKHKGMLYPEDAIWLGHGNLRYLLTKTAKDSGGNHYIRGTGHSAHGSMVGFNEAIVSRFEPLFDDLDQALSRHPLVALAACANIQRMLANVYEAEGSLDVEGLETTVSSVIDYCHRVSSL